MEGVTREELKVMDCDEIYWTKTSYHAFSHKSNG